MAAAMAFPGQHQDWEGSPCPVAHSVAHSVRSPVEALMGMSWAVAVAVLRNQRKEQESWARWMAHVGLIDSICETSVSMCNDNTSTKCDAGYTGILRPPQAPAIDHVHSRSAVCTVRQWLVLRKAGAFDTIDHASAHHVCAQSALECKTCANASLLIVVAIVSTLGVYAIGVVLGQKTVSHVDTQVEDPTLASGKVVRHDCSAVLAAC